MAKKQTRRSISVSRSTYERLKAFCETSGISMSQFVEGRVGDFLGASVRAEPVVTPSAPVMTAARPMPVAAASAPVLAPVPRTDSRPAPIVARPAPARPAPAVPKPTAESIFTF
jgi:hypothetical protein